MTRLDVGYRRRRPTGAFLVAASAIVLGNALAIEWHPRLGLGPTPEWPVAIDLLLILPALYLFLHRPLTRATLLRAATIAAVGVFIGSFLLPPSSNGLWTWVESGRYVAIVVVVALQLGIAALVVRDVLAVGEEPFETALHAAIARRVDGPLRKLLCLEARVWAYAFMSRRVLARWPATHSFLGARQGGNASNQQGFLIIVGAEIPIVHALLHFLWSPTAAIVVSALSVYGFLFLLAEYRATLYRPIVVGADSLHVRSGLLHDFEVYWNSIAAVSPCAPSTPRRARGRVRCFGMGHANVRLTLHPGSRIEGTFGPVEVTEIHLGVDEPANLAARVEARIGVGQRRTG